MTKNIIETNDPLQELKDNIYKAVGKNIIAYQQLEKYLKFLVAYGHIEGPFEKLKSIQKENHSRVYKKTMGQVASEYLNKISNSEPDSKEEKFPGLGYARFTFKTECEQQQYDLIKKDLEEVIQERNKLAHHFIEKCDSTSIECLHENLRNLESQQKKIFKTLDYYKDLVKHLDESRKILASFLSSSEGRLFFVEGILPGESRLDNLLKEIAAQTAQKDGWSLLTTAGKVLKEVKEHEPERIDKLCNELGIIKLKTLKKLIEASDSFEIIQRKSKTGSEWIYRPIINKASQFRH